MAQVVEQVVAARDVAVPAAARVRRTRRLGPALAIGFIVVLALIGLLAPILAPYDPINQDLNNQIGGPSAQHLLGTDSFGRDVLSRLI
ncbi:MAG TPA: hypothetical protein VE953_09595, partial [Terriglobales bacterium]|nr:hypothetical protein [Terriglobales bacterium]